MNLCYEAKKILSDLKVKFHSDYYDRSYYSAYYSVEGCDELLMIDDDTFTFNGVKVDYYGYPNADEKFNQVTGAKMIKLYIEEYRKKQGELNIGAYI